MDTQRYLEAIKLKIATRASVKQVDMVQDRIAGDQGYFRARLVLVHGDFWEVAEFFEGAQGEAEAAETQTWVEFAVKCKYLDEEVGRELYRMYDSILGKLVQMIRHAGEWSLERKGR